jgi:hypothetical protein
MVDATSCETRPAHGPVAVLVEHFEDLTSPDKMDAVQAMEVAELLIATLTAKIHLFGLELETGEIMRPWR